jgi:hypothetical protein
MFLAVVPCLASHRVIPDLKDTDTLLRTAILPDSAFNVNDMEKVARRFLEEAAKTHKTARLSIFADRTVAAQEAAACEGSFLQWKLLYDSFPKRALLAAYVVSLRGDAVLWLRTSDGSVFRRVLTGKDPTQISVDGVPLEILFVNGRVQSRFEVCGTPGAVVPILYLSTDAALDAEFCQRVTSWLAAKLDTKHIWAEFANDHWFPCDGRFPLRYPFSPAEPPLSEAAFYSLPGFGCGIFCDAEPRCLSSTPTRRVHRPDAH